jgi:hypothetical protein
LTKNPSASRTSPITQTAKRFGRKPGDGLGRDF